MKTVVALRVNQPIGEFFVTVMSASDLLGRVTNSERASDKDNADVQRLFNPKRVKDIAGFTGDPQATFPTPIILAVKSSVVKELVEQPVVGEAVDDPGAPDEMRDEEYSEKEMVTFEFPDEGVIGQVLDGQHRILGLKESTLSKKFDLVVILMFDLTDDDRAYVFSIINSKQTPVSSSLIYDLFDLSGTRSPQKTCHFIAKALDRQDGGPFFRRIKMLGRREGHHTSRVMLSQGTFAARLEELITRDAARDARLEKAKEPLPQELVCPLRKYYLRGEDEALLKILQNYFEAARRAFQAEWEDDSGQYIIRKTVGYTALIRVLRRTLPDALDKRDLSFAYFSDRFATYKANLGNNALTSDVFPSSGQGANKLEEALLGLNAGPAAQPGN